MVDNVLSAWLSQQDMVPIFTEDFWSAASKNFIPTSRRVVVSRTCPVYTNRLPSLAQFHDLNRPPAFFKTHY
jgi:hypothetical protein